ncbi:MAG: hypothetical protein KJ907_14480 [Actinobacteria bacterium]|nr:hypothetical protein [Actinomycetota bacterium]MBU4403923.1 hypothetical protein [Actinomycetota bacterium]MBU4442914.1 hypothetical protein [Actinomycetota bacterium]
MSRSRLVAWAALSLAALLAICALVGLAPDASARETKEPTSGSSTGTDAAVRKVLFVVMDRVGIDDWANEIADLPNLRNLVSRGAVGLMNAKAWFGQYGLGNYLIIGAGGRVKGAENAGLAFNGTERIGAVEGDGLAASAWFVDITGIVPPDGSVVNVAIEHIKTASSGIESTSSAGRLGQSLKEAGVKTYVCGNSDYEQPFPGSNTNDTSGSLAGETASREPGRVFQRQVSCIAMDESGMTLGDVSAWDPSPVAYNSSVRAYLAEVVGAASDGLARSDFVVVDMGETSRVEQLADWLPKDRLEECRRAALKSCDEALGGLLTGVDLEKDLLVVCAPTPTEEMVERGELFTPLLVAGPGFAPGSLLYSPTTRRRGLVSNFDLAPTILASFNTGIPARIEGATMFAVGGDEINDMRISSLKALKDKTLFYSSVRHYFLNVFVYLLIAVLVTATILLVVSPSWIAGHVFFWLSCLFCFLWAPVVFLVITITGIHTMAPAALFTIGLDLLLGCGTVLTVKSSGGRRKAGVTGQDGIADHWKHVPAAIAVVLLSTIVAVGLDPLLGSPMISFSPFGSTLAGAGRYYGIGNVYSGIVVGAAIVLACLLPDVFPSRLNSPGKVAAAAAGILFTAIIIVGSSKMGANVGGLLAGLAGAFLTLYWPLKDNKRGKKLAYVGAVMTAFLVVIFLMELLLPGPASHAARLASRVEANGLYEFWSVAVRKLQLNWKLLWTSVWRLLFFSSIALGLAWSWKPPVIKTITRKHRFMSAAFTGLIVTMIAGIAFNDTGIETAGAVSVYFLLPGMLIYLTQERMGLICRQRKKSQQTF